MAQLRIMWRTQQLLFYTAFQLLFKFVDITNIKLINNFNVLYKFNILLMLKIKNILNKNYCNIFLKNHTLYYPTDTS